jgi:hypothetical protein
MLIDFCRSDRIRLVSLEQELTNGVDIDQNEVLYEVLVNPFASDAQLLYALKHADESCLMRAAAFSCDFALMKSLEWPKPPDILFPILNDGACDYSHLNRQELEHVLARAAGNNVALAKAVADWLEKR